MVSKNEQTIKHSYTNNRESEKNKLRSHHRSSSMQTSIRCHRHYREYQHCKPQKTTMSSLLGRTLKYDLVSAAVSHKDDHDRYELTSSIGPMKQHQLDHILTFNQHQVEGVILSNSEFDYHPTNSTISEHNYQLMMMAELPINEEDELSLLSVLVHQGKENDNLIEEYSMGNHCVNYPMTLSHSHAAISNGNTRERQKMTPSPVDDYQEQIEQSISEEFSHGSHEYLFLKRQLERTVPLDDINHSNNQAKTCEVIIDFGCENINWLLASGDIAHNNDLSLFEEEEPMALLLRIVTFDATPGKQATRQEQEQQMTEFVAFGQSALDTYFNLHGGQSIDKLMLYYQFQHQLMELSELPIEQISLSSVNRSYELNGAVVLGHCLRYIASRVSLHLAQEDKIKWIIALPNDWPLTLRQLVRLAAYEAGLIENCSSAASNDLILVSNIEAASYYCVSTSTTFPVYPTHKSESSPQIGQPRLDLIIECNNSILSWCLLRHKQQWQSENNAGFDCVCLENWNKHSINLAQGFLHLLIDLFGVKFLQFYKYSYPKSFLQLIESFATATMKSASARCDNYNPLDMNNYLLDIELPPLFVNTFHHYWTESTQMDKRSTAGEDGYSFLSEYLRNNTSTNATTTNNRYYVKYDASAKTLQLNLKALISIYAPLIDAITSVIDMIWAKYGARSINIGNIYVVGCSLIRHQPLVYMSISEYLVSRFKTIAVSPNLNMISSSMAVPRGACLFARSASATPPSIAANLTINGWPCPISLGVGVVHQVECEDLMRSLRWETPLTNGGTARRFATLGDKLFCLDVFDRMIHRGQIVFTGQVVFRRLYRAAQKQELMSDKPLLLNIYKSNMVNGGVTSQQQFLSRDSRIMQPLATLELNNDNSYPVNGQQHQQHSELIAFELELEALDRDQFQLRVYKVKVVASSTNLVRLCCLTSLIVDMQV